MIQITDTIVLDDREIEERFVRATGLGGQMTTGNSVQCASTQPSLESICATCSVKVPLEHAEP
jgi:protein subunit release factor B